MVVDTDRDSEGQVYGVYGTDFYSGVTGKGKSQGQDMEPKDRSLF